MNMTEFSSGILLHIQGVPAPILLHAIRNTLINFCEETDYWRMDMGDEAAFSSVNEYSMPVPVGARIVRIISVQLNGRPIDSIDDDSLGDVSDWRNRQTLSGYKFDPVTQTIKLIGYPGDSVGQKISITVSLKPTRTATTFPEHIFEDEYDCIVEGACSRIMRLPDEKWNNPKESDRYYITHKHKRDKARDKAYKNHSRTELSAKMRPMA